MRCINNDIAQNKGHFALYRMREEHAFTLVELLVVIAIISVLAALLLPAMESAMQSARTVQCASNEKNVFLAWQTYIDDYAGRLPKAQSYFDDPVATNRTWTEIMAPYLEGAVVYKTSYMLVTGGYLNCPLNEWIGEKDRRWPDYGMNMYGIGGGTPGVYKPYHRLNDVKKPSEQFAFGDSKTDIYSAYPDRGFYMIQPQYVWDYGSTGWTSFRHSAPGKNKGRANMLYCDGHIEAKERDILVTNVSWRNKAPWGNPR